MSESWLGRWGVKRREKRDWLEAPIGPGEAEAELADDRPTPARSALELELIIRAGSWQAGQAKRREVTNWMS